MTPELSNSGVPLSQADVLASIYSAAAARVRQMVLHPAGKSDRTRAISLSQAALLGAQIDQVLQRLNVDAAKWVGANLPQAVQDGIARANQQAKAVGVASPTPAITTDNAFTLVGHDTVKAFAGDMVSDLSTAAAGMAARGKSVLRQTAQLKLSERDIDQILAVGVITGRPSETIRNLRDALIKVHGKTVPVADKNGDTINFDAGYYASMVARTKTRQAATVARHAQLRDLGLDLVSIVGLPSKNFCTAYLGQVFSIGGKSDKYPSLDELPGGGPPFHPNCSKSTRPYVEALATPAEQDAADGIDDADKFLGVDPSTAQKRFKDLQVYQQVKASYATTADKLFGRAA